MAELESSLISERRHRGDAGRRDARQAPRTVCHISAHRQQNRDPGHVHRSEHPRHTEENRRPGQPRYCRRNHQTRPRDPASGLVTTFYTYHQPIPGPWSLGQSPNLADALDNCRRLELWDMRRGLRLGSLVDIVR